MGTAFSNVQASHTKVSVIPALPLGSGAARTACRWNRVDWHERPQGKLRGHVSGGGHRVPDVGAILCRACPLLPVPIASDAKKGVSGAGMRARTRRLTAVLTDISPLKNNDTHRVLCASNGTAANTHCCTLFPPTSVVVCARCHLPRSVRHPPTLYTFRAVRVVFLCGFLLLDVAVWAGHPSARYGPPGSPPRRGEGGNSAVDGALAAHAMGRQGH